MKFQLPDQLPATADELNKLAAQATAEINVIQARHVAGEELSADDVGRLEYLLDSRDTIDTELASVTASETEHADRLAKALERTAPKADPAPEAPADPAAEDTAADAAADVVAEAEQATADAAEQAPVVAAGDQRPVTFAGATAGKDDLPAGVTPGQKPKPWTLLKSAPRFAEFGTELVDSRVLADAIDSVQPGQRTGRQQTGSRVIGRETFATQALATLNRPQGKLVKSAAELFEELDRIQREHPLLGRESTLALALTAAGGWVSPSEQLYDFCPTQPVRNVVSLPEISVSRGGLRFADEPDFSGLLTGFHFSEAELEAVDGGGEPTAIKEFVEIPGVEDFTEYRLEAIGWAVKAGILQNQGWPELTEKFINEFMVAHQYRVSALTITKMLGESDAARTVPTDAVLGATTSILNGLHVRAKNIQIKTRIDTIEGVAPIWFRDVLKADLANRDGVDALDVTDAQVDGWLADRGIHLQYEQAWQSLATGKPGDYDTDWWPGSVDVILYPAGTFFRALDNVVTFGVQYPIEQVQKNRYTHGFVEDSFLVGKRCYPSHLIRIPLCVNGAVGSRESIDCTGPYMEMVTKTLTVSGTPTGGSVAANFSGLGGKSATIVYNSTNSQAKTALVAMDDGLVAANFTVTGGALPGTPLVITYPAILGTLSVVSSLTGGTSPAASLS